MWVPDTIYAEKYPVLWVYNATNDRMHPVVWVHKAINNPKHPGTASSEGILAIQAVKYPGGTCDVGTRYHLCRKLPSGLGITSSSTCLYNRNKSIFTPVICELAHFTELLCAQLFFIQQLPPDYGWQLFIDSLFLFITAFQCDG